MKSPSVFASLFVLITSTAHSEDTEEPLLIDKNTGQYKNLSYDALTDVGLSWQNRTQLFGGETVNYGELKDTERTKKQKELKTLLARIEARENQNWADPKLIQRVEAEILTWLNNQIEPVTAIQSYTGEDVQRLRNSAVGFFRAYEIFGDEKYLSAGLRCADLILGSQ